MIDTFAIYSDLKESFGDEPARKMAGVIGQIYSELSQSVRRDDFNELKSVVAELAEAQVTTGRRLDSLTVKVGELADAQAATEHRLDSLTIKVEELAEAQKRTEARLEELADAQAATERRLDSLTVKVEELAEAQKRTELKVEELAEAQKRTEQEVRKLAKGLRETRQMVGGLSDSVGYGLEDRAIAALPALLKIRFGLEPEAPFVRRFMDVGGKEVELNMFGTGHKDNEKWFVVGEGKAKLSKKDVDRFLKLLEQLKAKHVVGDNVLPLLVTYSTRPAIQEYAENKGMHVIWSYELEQVRL